MNHPFNDEDLLVIFEAAFQALRVRHAVFDNLADCLDINEEELERIRRLLEGFLNDKFEHPKSL